MALSLRRISNQVREAAAGRGDPRRVGENRETRDCLLTPSPRSRHTPQAATTTAGGRNGLVRPSPIAAQRRASVRARSTAPQFEKALFGEVRRPQAQRRHDERARVRCAEAQLGRITTRSCRARARRCCAPAHTPPRLALHLRAPTTHLDFGARDATAGELASNFSDKVLGNFDTEHIIK